MAESNWQKTIRKISIHSNIRQDLVEHIMKSAVDVILVEIVNKGKFNFLGMFNVKSKEWKGYSLGGRKINDHQRLSVTLSKTVKELWKIRFQEFDGDDTVIDENNWRTIYKTYTKKQKRPSNPKTDDEEDSIFNPFLDDDDEDY